MTIKIILNTKPHPVGKLADAELHFTEGPFAGLKLLGFAVWEHRNGAAQTCTCAMNADGSAELPFDADCPTHGEEENV